MRSFSNNEPKLTKGQDYIKILTTKCNIIQVNLRIQKTNCFNKTHHFLKIILKISVDY